MLRIAERISFKRSFDTAYKSTRIAECISFKRSFGTAHKSTNSSAYGCTLRYDSMPYTIHGFPKWRNYGLCSLLLLGYPSLYVFYILHLIAVLGVVV